MYAMRLMDPPEGTACEQCGKTGVGEWGVVSLSKIRVKMDLTAIDTKREAAEELIWDDGKGEILCKPCLATMVNK